MPIVANISMSRIESYTDQPTEAHPGGYSTGSNYYNLSSGSLYLYNGTRFVPAVDQWPIGSMNYQYQIAPGATSFGVGQPLLRSGYDWLVSQGIGKWMNLRPLYYDTASYSSLGPVSVSGHTLFRMGVFKLGSNFGCFISQSTFMQTTTNLTTMTNRDVPAFAINDVIAISQGNRVWFDQVSSSYIANIWGGSSYIYSTDGATWNFVPYVNAPSASLAPNNIQNVVSNKGVYSFYDATKNKRYYTTDHVTFTRADTPNSMSSVVSQPIHVVNDTLFAVDAAGTGYKTSADGGITWTSRSYPASVSGAPTTPYIVYNGSTFLFCTTGGVSNTTLYTSPDLVTWTQRTASFSPAVNINRLGVANGTFFAFSAASQTTFCTSPDGVTWTLQTASNAAIYGECAYVNSKYFVFATTRVESSANLSTWGVEVTTGPAALARVGADRYLVTSGSQIVFCSSTGVWNAYDTGVWTSILTSAQQNGVGFRTSAIAGSTVSSQGYMRAKT